MFAAAGGIVENVREHWTGEREGPAGGTVGGPGRQAARVPAPTTAAPELRRLPAKPPDCGTNQETRPDYEAGGHQDADRQQHSILVRTLRRLLDEVWPSVFTQTEKDTP